MIPYPGMRNSTVIEQVTAGFRLPSPESCPSEVYALMQECWDADPDARPSFSQIAAKFDGWISTAQSTVVANVIFVDDTNEYN